MNLKMMMMSKEAITDGVNKAFEGLMPGLTDIIQNKKFAVTVRRTSPNSVEVVRPDGTPYELSDDIVEQMNMMINITTLLDVKR